jgi:starvation-inducible DNA-binding protein
MFLSADSFLIREMKIIEEKNHVTKKMYRTENDIEKSTRMELNTLLNARLADVIDLQLQMKQAHWNVKGPHFISLHELFDQIAESIGKYGDTLAERVVQLGGVAEGTVRVVGKRSTLKDYPLTIGEGLAHVRAVAAALATFGTEVRKSVPEAEKLEDPGTVDILTEISRGTDKWLWFVEAHIQTE